MVGSFAAWRLGFSVVAAGLLGGGSAVLWAQGSGAGRADGSAPSTCRSRLRQMALALEQYSNDHDGRLPPAGRWNDALPPQPKSEAVFSCPSLGTGSYGYSMNWKFSRRLATEADSPAATVLLYETNVPRRNAAYDGGDLIFRHEQNGRPGANYAFANGQVRWLPVNQKPNFRVFLDNKPRR
jgi:hypothetical protein